MLDGGRQGGHTPPRFWPNPYCAPPDFQTLRHACRGLQVDSKLTPSRFPADSQLTPTRSQFGELIWRTFLESLFGEPIEKTALEADSIPWIPKITLTTTTRQTPSCLPGDPQRTPSGLPEDSQWTTSGLPMDSHWTPSGLPADSQQTPSRLPQDSQRTPSGLPVDSQQTPTRSQFGELIWRTFWRAHLESQLK